MLSQKVNVSRSVLGARRAFACAIPSMRSGPAPAATRHLQQALASQAGTSRFSATMAHALATASISAVPALQGATYKDELTAACEAVRLASKLCQAVQRQLADAEKVEKSDSSPVTVADYGQ
jgi:hypothetical protein